MLFADAGTARRTNPRRTNPRVFRDAEPCADRTVFRDYIDRRLIDRGRMTAVNGRMLYLPCGAARASAVRMKHIGYKRNKRCKRYKD